MSEIRILREVKQLLENHLHMEVDVTNFDDNIRIVEALEAVNNYFKSQDKEWEED
jgi:hypothetical protein